MPYSPSVRRVLYHTRTINKRLKKPKTRLKITQKSKKVTFRRPFSRPAPRTSFRRMLARPVFAKKTPLFF